MNITKATVIENEYGMDKIIVETDILEPTWPFKGYFSFLGFIAKGDGAKFVRTNFNLEPEVVIVGGPSSYGGFVKKFKGI